MICLTVSVGAFRLYQTDISTLLNPIPPDRNHVLDQPLVDPHLEGIPGLATLTARSLAGGDLETLGRQTHGALDVQRLGARALNEFLAHLLERGDLARGQGDADLVDFLCFVS
jgi:hypothetical protein